MIRPRQIRLQQPQARTILLGGGLDLETPMMSVGEGFALEADNFEPNLNGGYRKMLGFERFDGRAAPSEQVYYTIQVADSSAETVGSTLTGGTSGATAELVIKDDDLNLLGVTDLAGNFEADEVIGSTTVVVPESLQNYPDEKISAVWEKAAQDYWRAFIQAVPGTGPVLGVWFWLGKAYAWRSNGSVVKMFESSATGWQEVTLYSLIEWNNGVLSEGDIVAGDTITGATSGATATVKSFIKVEGAYGSTASGYAVIEVLTGTFTASETINEGATARFDLDGGVSDIEFTLGANRFDFVNHNFSGSPDSYHMYGCDGVNRGFEWDGTILTPIVTGNTADAPTHIEAHSNHLFFAFDGGSLQSSIPVNPLVFNGLIGSFEIAVGEEISGLKSVIGNALLVSTNRGIQGLFGKSVDDWIIQPIATDSGDAGNTLDVIGSPMMVTRRGITKVSAGDLYGNFGSSTVSRRINPLLRAFLQNKTLIGANVIRDKNQYKIYFGDGTGIILTSDQLFGDQGLPAFTTFSYIDYRPSCLCSVPRAASDEIVLFGDENGFVYQEERGNSHDGDEVQYALRLPFHHLGSPQVRKSFKWLDIESDVERTADLRVTYEYSDGSSHTAASPIRDYEFQGGSRAYWDEGDWSLFNWNDELVSRENLSMSGAGHNVSVLFFGISAVTAPFTINAITYQYLPRRLKRG